MWVSLACRAMPPSDWAPRGFIRPVSSKLCHAAHSLSWGKGLEPLWHELLIGWHHYWWFELILTFLGTVVLSFCLCWFEEIIYFLLKLIWKKAVSIACDSLLDTFTGDSLAGRCLDGHWLQRDVHFPPGKTGRVGMLKKSLWVTGLAVLPFPGYVPGTSSITKLSCLSAARLSWQCPAALQRCRREPCAPEPSAPAGQPRPEAWESPGAGSGLWGVRGATASWDEVFGVMLLQAGLETSSTPNTLLCLLYGAWEQ